MLPLLGQYIFSHGKRAKALTWRAWKLAWRSDPREERQRGPALVCCRVLDESLSAHGEPSGASLCVLWRHWTTVEKRRSYRLINNHDGNHGYLLLLIWFCLLRQIWIGRYMMRETTIFANNYSWKPHWINISLKWSHILKPIIVIGINKWQRHRKAHFKCSCIIGSVEKY